MSDGTLIEWTDATWNLINGCTVLSPGCTNCYAMRLAGTRLRNHPSREGLTKVVNGNPVWTGEVLFNRAVALDPFKWREPRRIFVCAHGDLFHAEVPDAWIDYVFFMAMLCPQHTFQILTKRPERMREYMRIVLDETEQQTAGRFAIAAKHAGLCDHPRVRSMDINWPPRNVWLGTSVEDQKRAEERVPVLIETPAVVRWLSCEPLLGPVDLTALPSIFGGVHRPLMALNALLGFHQCGPAVIVAPGSIDWIVVGGESGPGSRPMHAGWARLLRDSCRAAGVPFHFKQWGDWAPGFVLADKIRMTPAQDLSRFERRGGFVSHEFANDATSYRIGKKLAGRELDGRTWDEYPEIAA